MRQGTKSRFKMFPDWEVHESDLPGQARDPWVEVTRGNFVMELDKRVLTRGKRLVGRKSRVVDGPLVSAFHVAGWLTWNYWRLSYEPGRHVEGHGDSGRPETNSDRGFDWLASHRLSGIGNGYDWPDIEFVPDGQLVTITSKPKQNPGVFDHTYEGVDFVGLDEFQRAMQSFIKATVKRLDDKKQKASDLHDAWKELQEEINKPELALYRRLEAMLGFGPGEGKGTLVEDHLDDVDRAGLAAMQELACHNGSGDRDKGAEDVLGIDDLDGMASEGGHESSSKGMFRLNKTHPSVRKYGRRPAHEIGFEAAKAVREDASLNGSAVSDEILAGMAGVDADALESDAGQNAPLSFSAPGGNAEYIVLNQENRPSRRFDLTRIIGDRAIGDHLPGDAGSGYHLATRSSTYRQQYQRVFAALLLCPPEAVRGMGQNPGEESIGELASDFMVSPMVVEHNLQNLHNYS